MDPELLSKAREIVRRLRKLPPDQRKREAAKLWGDDDLLRSSVISLWKSSETGKRTASADAPSPAPETDKLAPKITGYESIGRLGEGAMGIVWEALQLSTRRRVALKLLSEASLGSERRKKRFAREVELAAGLEHPNIARVYESGLDKGVYYYAMELVRGVPLDVFVEQRELNSKQILELVRQICIAMEYAHSRGVVHRDLKPSNILVGDRGEPHVLDFGLAKMLDSEDKIAMSSDGDVTGTPMFMSPEQAAGDVNSVNARSDVYALGIIAYRLLTHQSPHDLSGSYLEVIRRVAEEEVRRPRSFARELDSELEAVLLKALSHDSADRYPSAGAMGGDIDNYLNGRPLIARKPTVLYLLRKKFNRHRAPAVAAVAACVVVVLLAIGLRSGGWLRELLAVTHIVRVAQPPIVKEIIVPATQVAEAPESRPVVRGDIALAIPIKSDADVIWEQVKNLDRGQGFGNQLDQAAALRLSANTFFDHSIYDSAGNTYQQFIKLCNAIQAADADRQTAVGARDKATAALKSAGQAGAIIDAPELWTQSQTMAAEAQRQFDAAGFAAAKAGWIQAAQSADDAASKASATAPLRLAKQQYDDAIETMDIAHLNKFGGADWKAVKDAVASAAAAAQKGDTASAATSYQNARRLLPAAVATADDQSHKADLRRVQPEITQHVAAARDLIRRQQNSAALGEIQKSLALNPNDVAAGGLRTDLLKNDLDGSVTLGVMLPPLKFDGNNLGECIGSIQAASGLHFTIDTRTLAAAGVDVNTVVNLNLGPETLESVLGQVCAITGGQTKLGCLVDNGMITISTLDKINSGPAQMITYNVSDLGRTQQDFDKLATLIYSNVDQYSWKVNGGTVGQIASMTGKLVVTTNQQNQRAVAKLLQSLRQK